MKRTVLVSFPRSGHHLLINLLFKYYAKNPNLANLNLRDCKEIQTAGKLSYCEYYQHCCQKRFKSFFSCPNKPTIQKYHDQAGLRLNDEEPKLREFNLIVQYRDPIPTLVSWYNYHLGRKDSKSHWNEYLIHSLRLWKSWTNRWLYSDLEVLKVDYSDLVDTTEIILTQIIHNIDPKHTVDKKLLKEVVTQSNVMEKRDITQFRYCSQKLLKIHKNLSSWKQRRKNTLYSDLLFEYYLLPYTIPYFMKNTLRSINVSLKYVLNYFRNPLLNTLDKMLYFVWKVSAFLKKQSKLWTKFVKFVKEKK